MGDFHFNGHVLLEKYPSMAQALDKYRINPGILEEGKTDKHFETILELAQNGKNQFIGVNGVA